MERTVINPESQRDQSGLCIIFISTPSGVVVLIYFRLRWRELKVVRWLRQLLQMDTE